VDADADGAELGGESPSSGCLPFEGPQDRHLLPAGGEEIEVGVLVVGRWRW
jgi:hypothetical protein